MVFKGGRVRGQATRLAAVVPAADGVESAVAVVVEAALDGGPGQAGEAAEVGPGQPVGGQAEEFHPALDLGARVVVAVMLDLVQDIRWEVEPTHGILPGVEGAGRRTRNRPAGKAQLRTRRVYVVKTADALVPHLRAGQLLSLESTTYPGTTEELLLPRLQARGFAVGTDVFLVFSPERVDPGNQQFPIEKIPKVVGGMTDACRAAGVTLYGSIVARTVPVSSPRAAEMAKLLENIYRCVNIGLVNELKLVADRMGIDIWEVIDAAATKPFGFTPFYPGPGLGGHCIPIDPFYLTWKAREYGLHTRFIELAGEVNTAMPAWVVAKTADALNDRGKPLRGSRLLVLGIAYKKNIDDPRESPALELMARFQQKGATVSYSDPHIPVAPPMRHYDFDKQELRSVGLTPQTLAAADAVVLATDHDRFDYAAIAANARLVVDTRGRYRKALPNVVRC